MGAILVSSILVAGGRNVVFEVLSRSKHDKMTSIMRMEVFTQFWYQYFLIYSFSLSFAQNSFIEINYDLKTPKFEFISNAKPSLFEYPRPMVPPTTTSTIKFPHLFLSTSARAKTRGRNEANHTSIDEKLSGDDANASISHNACSFVMSWHRCARYLAWFLIQNLSFLSYPWLMTYNIFSIKV